MSDARGAPVMAWLREDPRRFDLAVAVLVIGLGSLLLQSAPEEFDTGWPEVAAGVGAFVMVALRRWRPLPLLVAALSWGAIHVSIYQRPTPIFFAILVLLFTVCVSLDRWRAIALGVVVAAPLYGFGLYVNEASAGDQRATIGIVWTFLAVGVADATRSWRQYKESADAQVRAAVLAAEAETRQQVSEERLAIARELHDLLAHSLSVMNVQTGAALHLLRNDPDQAEQSLTAARDAGKTVLDELRELLGVLRHADGDDPPTSSLPTVDQIDALVDTMRSAGLAVEWTVAGARRPLAPAVSLAAYRIVQESLTNAAKHGTGSADLATVWDDDGLTIQVANAVAGESGAGSGHGLVGMRERAVANGGRLEVDADGVRFLVDAWLPVTAGREAMA
ncbi:MAG: sensor histidine kinase [Actinomycetota bacterium]